MPRFFSTIYKIGINPVVDPPDRAMKSIFSHAGRAKGPIPVRGKLNGAEFVQTLVKYGGSWRLYINGPMLKASGLHVGDRAMIEIEFDPTLRTIPMPGELAAALRKDRQAREAFNGLPPSRQKEIMRYIGSLKTQVAISDNVGRIIAHLRGEKIDHVLTRSRRER
ncbi:MAG: YdeI/OmpD-associated family protein [Acidobacteriota bacterium]